MKHLFLSLIIGLFSTSLWAGETKSLTPEQTWQLVQEKGAEILFVDVRDPIEIMFVGFADAVDINVPFKLADRYDFVAEKKHFAMKVNPEFVADIEKALQHKGLDKDALIITMCRSGSDRGKPSAEFLQEQGFTNVKYVENGFQGDKASQGQQQEMRVVNGWINSGLPWSSAINPEKIYRP
jgi:rhodanese-related sulfurtransferase